MSIPTDEDGRTPLSPAGDGHEGIVRILLERGDIDFDTADGGGRAPLWWAAQGGQEAIANLLRERTNLILSFQDVQRLCNQSTQPSELSEPPFKRTRVS